MGKKSKKQRKAERASKSVCAPKGVRLGVPRHTLHDLVFGAMMGTEGRPCVVTFSAGLVRESTLPSALTDLLKVEAPKRYSSIPPHANHCKAEDRFEYLKGMRAGEPVAMRCPDCDVRLGLNTESPHFVGFIIGGRSSSFSACRYCGVTYTFHGSRLVWWR